MTTAVGLGLHDGFVRSAQRVPDRPALEAGGQVLSYAQLQDRAAALAATIAREHPGGPPLTALFADRSSTAFEGMLGTLLHGHGYVPLNPTLPAARSRLMLDRAGARTVIADCASAPGLVEVLVGIADPVTVIIPDGQLEGLARALPSRHRVVDASGLAPADAWEGPPPADPERIAYLLFTSGSTGIPKGVMVAHRNIAAFLEMVAERYDFTEQDRFSQTHELTFDVSVFDAFAAWACGACLCCPTRKEMIAPGRWINSAGITVWLSVPSTAIFMKRLGMLKPGRYPRVRWSLFAGEPLPVEVARAWLAAAPNGAVENLYGPTELTIVCVGYRWDPERSESECEAGTVPIGTPLPGNEILVADTDLREVPPGETGELLVTGPQVTLGYWRDEERTDQVFVVPPGSHAVHYRTGDRVRQPVDDRPVHYLGRLDHQIKVRGVRVELGEVEAGVREVTGVDAVVCVGWPVTEVGADGIVAFVGDTGVDAAAVRAALEERLPAPMVPRRFVLMEELPLNQNGKFDRKGLTDGLVREEG
jgi:amino acid adenylation domain-containing protein